MATPKKPAGKRPPKKFQSEETRKTARYQPTGRGHPLFWPDADIQPKFTWGDVPRMRRDPTVLMASRIIAAPLYGASLAVGADSANIEQYVRSTFSRIWTRALNKILRYLDYGHAGGEVTYAVERGRFAFAQIHDAHPLDIKPLRLDGQFVGVRVANVRGMRTDGDLAPPNAFWVNHAAEYGQLYGRSVYEGAWEPWWEKCAKHGAKDIRRLWFLKNAYSGGTIRHPPGETEVGDGKFISNHDLAAEILQKLETGGVLVLPNTIHPLTKEFLWSYDPPKINGELTGLLDYVKMLDREILLGMGVPPEILEAAEVGSGWSGRSVPFKVFFSTLDQLLMEIVEAVDRLIVRHLVAANFGDRAADGYEVRPTSLVKQAEKESAADRATIRVPAEDESPLAREVGAANGVQDGGGNARQAVQAGRGEVRGQPPVRRLSLLEFAEEMPAWERKKKRRRKSGTIILNDKA